MVTPRIRQTFKTLAEFVSSARASGSRETREDNRNDRTGSGTFEEACSLALRGWAEGVKEIATLSAKVADHVASTMEAIDWGYDVEPANLDIARFLEGEPECWLTPSVRHIAAQGKLLTLVFNGGVSSSFGPSDIIRRGSAVVSLVDCLERAGHSVRLVWNCTIRERGELAEVTVTVKNWGESLHIGQVAFALAHPSMLRRLFFAIQDGWNAEDKETFDVIAGGRGSPHTVLHDAKGDVTIKEMHLGRTPEDLEGWIVEQLKAQGITIRERAD